MFTSKTRREFLISAGAATALFFLPTKVAQAQELRTRKNVASPDAEGDLASLRDGVSEMKRLINTDPEDPRGWILQAYIHGNCNDFTDCKHSNWYFAPWHRSYLYYFEQLIQHFSGNATFALPYWDWSQTHTVPSSFYGDANPLDDNISIQSICSSAPTAGRGRPNGEEITQQELEEYVGPVRIESIQQNPDYATYGGIGGSGELEVIPHNFIHRWVGDVGGKNSNMVQFFSPLDPIFWMHHCNIDRLYSDWLSRPGHLPPSEDEWQNQSFNEFYDVDKNQVGSEFTCGQTVDSRVMGYVYSTDQITNLTQTLAARSSITRQQVVESVIESKSILVENVLSFEANVDLSLRTRRLISTAAVGAPNYVVRLRIEGIKTPKQQNTGVFVFLGPDITAETPISAPGYVGNFTFFEGQGGGNRKRWSHGHKKNVLLNATEAVKRLYGDTRLSESNSLKVSIVTRSLFGDQNAFASVEEIQPNMVQIDVVDLNA